MQQTMPENWLLFTAMRGDQAIATSLIAVQAINTKAIAKKDTIKIAYGRYWGALESIDCLHFEACYYQAIEWCIQRGYHRFEGAHKVSTKWLALCYQSKRPARIGLRTLNLQKPFNTF